MKPAGLLEVEVKLRIASTGALVPRLRAAGFVLRHDAAREANQLWDRAGALKAEDCALRLRQYGEQSLLTWKGARVADPQLKIRPELQTAVADAQAMAAILEALGYQPTLTMDKIRAIWDRGELEACLDETPHGSFLELEGPREAIAQAMAELGMEAGQIEPRSYATLYTQ